METNNPNHCIGVSVQHISKKFCTNIKQSLLYGLINILKCSIGFRPDNTYLKQGEFWALNDINFDFKRGQVCGIIGPNGSGKSTLLRLLAGVFPPDNGSAVIHGRVCSFITHNIGFHPHLTVKENVYINAAIHGMSKDEIDEKYSDIIKFSGIEPFVYSPVGIFSSGMYVRLGFSIVLALEHDIFLIDEILTVADKEFRKKCINEIIKKSEKETILIVSHNIEIIKKICNAVIILNKGRIQYIDRDVEAGIEYYNSMIN